MASRGVTVLKFVGTVSIGLLTGLSYSLSTLTIPTLLALPSASTAAKAYESLSSAAKTKLRVLAGVSGSAFALAFIFSPRQFRHPYLLYASVLVLGSRLATSDFAAPYLFRPTPSSPVAEVVARKQKKEKVVSHHHHMEASYEMLGSGSELHSEGTDSATPEEAAGDEENLQDMNGEDVRAKVEVFLQKQVVQTGVAGLGFVMAVVGIWGDGASQVFGGVPSLRI